MARIEFSGRAELVAHVGEEARLHLVRAPQVLGLLVQLGVERDHAAVRVLQLAVEAHQVLLAPAQLVEDVQQLLVLLLHLGQRVLQAFPGQLLREPARGRGACRKGDRRGQELLDRDRGPQSGVGLDREAVHQPARAEDAQAHARRRAVAAGEDQIAGRRCPGPDRSRDRDQHLGRRLPVDRELDLAFAGVVVDVARDLGDRGRDADLVLRRRSPGGGRAAGPAGAPPPRPAPDGHARSTGEGSRAGLPGHHDRDVVSLAAVITIEDRGHERGVTGRQSWIGRRDSSGWPGRPRPARAGRLSATGS